jgi:hypothetical protein
MKDVLLKDLSSGQLFVQLVGILYLLLSYVVRLDMLVDVIYNRQLTCLAGSYMSMTCIGRKLLLFDRL